MHYVEGAWAVKSPRTGAFCFAHPPSLIGNRAWHSYGRDSWKQTGEGGEGLVKGHRAERGQGRANHDAQSPGGWKRAPPGEGRAQLWPAE